MGNFALGVGVDILRGNVGSRDGGAILASVREARRSVEVGQKIGQNKDVLDAPGGSVPTEGVDEEILRREAELTAELEAIRERRGA